jgi:hypothetical protein
VRHVPLSEYLHYLEYCGGNQDITSSSCCPLPSLPVPVLQTRQSSCKAPLIHETSPSESYHAAPKKKQVLVTYKYPLSTTKSTTGEVTGDPFGPSCTSPLLKKTPRTVFSATPARCREETDRSLPTLLSSKLNQVQGHRYQSDKARPFEPSEISSQLCLHTFDRIGLTPFHHASIVSTLIPLMRTFRTLTKTPSLTSSLP